MPFFDIFHIFIFSYFHWKLIGKSLEKAWKKLGSWRRHKTRGSSTPTGQTGSADCWHLYPTSAVQNHVRHHSRRCTIITLAVSSFVRWACMDHRGNRGASRGPPIGTLSIHTLMNGDETKKDNTIVIIIITASLVLRGLERLGSSNQPWHVQGRENRTPLTLFL